MRDQLITLAIPQANFTTHKTNPPNLQILPTLPIPPNCHNSSQSFQFFQFFSSASHFFLFFWFLQFFAIHNPVAMAMAMGVASLAVTAPKHTLATPRASANRGEKQGFLDWFRTAMDKESLSEMDDVMAKGSEDGKSSNGNGNGNGNGKAASAPKKVAAAPPKKAGFNFPWNK